MTAHNQFANAVNPTFATPLQEEDRTMSARMTPRSTRTPQRGAPHALRLLAAALLILLAPAVPAQLDICGCQGLPGSFGAFDTLDPATWPAGSSSSFRNLVIPLPADGILVFDSINIAPRTVANGGINDSTLITVSFVKNAANTPVTILCKGDVNVAGGATVFVGGNGGGNGTTGVNGSGGHGGPGGFRGGDGAYQLVNFATNGGPGLGPGGGVGSIASPRTNATSGVYVGVPEILPLVGGSGGGGGCSISTGSNGSAGGGGGGGGAILIAANGTITVNGSINADGGNGGSPNDFNGGERGFGGTGGAIRLVANLIQGGGSLFARSGDSPFIGRIGTAFGKIRLEAFTNTMSADNTSPIASRAPAPGPITNPFSPTVQITAIDGQAPPSPPQGVFGVVDVVLPAPGPTPITVASSGVPVGTVIRLTIKPRVGGATITHDITLGAAGSNCDGSGNCTSTAVVNLPAGAYTVEAQATLQTP